MNWINAVNLLCTQQSHKGKIVDILHRGIKEQISITCMERVFQVRSQEAERTTPLQLSF